MQNEQFSSRSRCEEEEEFIWNLKCAGQGGGVNYSNTRLAANVLHLPVCSQFVVNLQIRMAVDAVLCIERVEFC